VLVFPFSNRAQPMTDKQPLPSCLGHGCGDTEPCRVRLLFGRFERRPARPVRSGASDPLPAASRSMNFCTLPEPVSGSAGTTYPLCGTLCGARRCLAHPLSSGGDGATAPGGDAYRRGDGLSPPGVRHPEHGSLGDRRVVEQDVLDLAWVDVLPAANAEDLCSSGDQPC